MLYTIPKAKKLLNIIFSHQILKGLRTLKMSQIEKIYIPFLSFLYLKKYKLLFLKRVYIAIFSFYENEYCFYLLVR